MKPSDESDILQEKKKSDSDTQTFTCELNDERAQNFHKDKT